MVSVGKSDKRDDNVLGGKLSKAALVGANKVNGPDPEEMPSGSHVSIAKVIEEW